jgi:3-dehydroquinate dehydratase
MKRIPDKDLDALSEIYRSNPPPSKDIDLEAYKRKIEELDEKYGKYDDIIPSHNKYDRIPLQHTIDRMKASYEEVGDRYRNNKGKKYKDYNPEDY